MILRRIVVYFLLLVLIGSAATLGGVGYWWRQSKLPVGAGAPVRITVPEGANARSVGEMLQSQRVIRNARAFAILAREKTIKPGVYDLSPAETPTQILGHLEKGDVVTEKVTFPEGFTLDRIIARLVDRKLAREAELRTLVTTQGNTFQASFTPPANLEGYLFPDTYRFPLGETERDLAQRMLGNFDQLVARGKAEQIKRSKRSLSDIVTIASMIEREARTPGDRPKIAGVIYNRLARNMPLQIDATVQYAQGVHKSRLLYRDLEIDSPYNTYRVRGLPPGPICSPGMASIEAALAPERSEYLYYVARPDGSHIFGRTMADHQRNIAQARREARGAR